MPCRSRFPAPAAYSTSSVSQMTARWPDRSFRLFAVPSENFSKEAIGEYFLSMSSSRSVKISSGSPDFKRRVERISFGMTTLPSSSILLTIPVAFIISPCAGRMFRRAPKINLQ